MKPDVLQIDTFLDDHAVLFQDLLQTVAWDNSMATRRTASFGSPYNDSQMHY